MRELPEELVQRMVAWRHDIHKHPEFGFEEDRTSELVAKELEALGIEVETGIGKTGVVGKLTKGQSNRAIGLRADMDCLLIQEINTFEHRSVHAGKMHACGHDGHTAILLGAAAYLAKSDEFDGTVCFFFQPAEEHGAGAQSMIDDGLFERYPVDSIYALHNMPGIPVGKFAVRSGAIMSSEDNFEIVITGKGVHASMPHQGIDPVVISAQIVLALQTIVSRNSNPTEVAVLSVTDIITDGTRNVVPNSVTIRGDVRTFDKEIQKMVEERMRQIVKGICESHGAQHSVSYTHDFIPTINAVRETNTAIEAAQKSLGEENVITNIQPATTSEDCARMLDRRPGCYALIGNGDGPGGCGLHNPNYDFNDDILKVGAAFFVEVVATEMPAHSTAEGN